MRPDEFMKKYGFDKEDEEKEHSLRENALDHAKHLKRPHAGTPHDWEDWQRYRDEHPDEVAEDQDTDEKRDGDRD
ncbi:MAG: hypothetical protein KGY54_08800 [Oleiphilaceae bacterium]|nr:hypothetical protein [Oleiphilaceae bacterium]